MFSILNRALSWAITSFGNKFCLKKRSWLIKALDNRFYIKFTQLEIGLLHWHLCFKSRATEELFVPDKNRGGGAFVHLDEGDAILN